MHSADARSTAASRASGGRAANRGSVVRHRASRSAGSIRRGEEGHLFLYHARGRHRSVRNADSQAIAAPTNATANMIADSWARTSSPYAVELITPAMHIAMNIVTAARLAA